MNTKTFFGNWIVRNLLLAIIIAGALLAGAVVFLSFVTNHGEEIAVPDFTGMSVAESNAVAHECGLRIDVTDSVYVRQMGRGLVFSQNPHAGGKVKSGRRIMLTINSVNPKRVTMPNLVGLSMRQAKAELMSKGLLLGNLKYVEDMATNNVLKQLRKGREIKAGDMIDSGASIDLVVGLGTDDQTFVPDVVGMKYLRAVDAVHDNSLNVARLHFDKNILNYSDSLDAVVYKQTPSPSSDMSIRIGSEISLYLKRESK